MLAYLIKESKITSSKFGKKVLDSFKNVILYIKNNKFNLHIS